MKPNKIKTMMLLLSVIVFISCGNKIEKIEDEDKPKEDVLLSETVNLDVKMSQYGQAKQIVKAPRMLQFLGSEGKYTTFPDGIYVESFTDALTLESTIEAKFAKMREGRTEFYSAYDSVVVTNYIRGIKVITDTLYWDRVNRKIYNNCFSRFFIPNGTFDAYDGMWALEDLSYYEIYKIREGDLILERQSKSDTERTTTITFPDTADLQPKPIPAPAPVPAVNKPPENQVLQEQPPQKQLIKKPNRKLELQQIN